jgi:hypothetical protein
VSKLVSALVMRQNACEQADYTDNKGSSRKMRTVIFWRQKSSRGRLRIWLPARNNCSCSLARPTDASAIDLVLSAAIERDEKRPEVLAGAVVTRVNRRPPEVTAGGMRRLALANSNVSGIATKLRSSAIRFGI